MQVNKKNKKVKKKVVNKKPIKKQPKKNVTKVKVKVTKIKYGRIFLVLTIIFLIIYLLVHIINFPIKNIFIYNNEILTDYEIIEMAGIEDYPSLFFETSNSIEKKIEKNIYIKNCEVKKKKLKEIHIYIEENYPLYYDATNGYTIFENKKILKEELSVPVLINYVPDTISNTLINKLSNIDKEILKRISEIKYDPNTVDDERFILTMTDGNYIDITLEYFEKINSYIDVYLDIIEKYGNKTGILYLDSGEYFKIIE